MESKKSIEQIAASDGRYSPDAISFVYEGLGYTVRTLKADGHEEESRHVSGQELSRGIGRLAQNKWGRMAKAVLNNWGLNTTRDFGEIVYLMISHQWMSANPEDRIEDFDDVYDFEQFFVKNFKFEFLDKK